jgi:hypothetical protein
MNAVNPLAWKNLCRKMRELFDFSGAVEHDRQTRTFEPPAYCDAAFMKRDLTEDF